MPTEPASVDAGAGGVWPYACAANAAQIALATNFEVFMGPPRRDARQRAVFTADVAAPISDLGLTQHALRFDECDHRIEPLAGLEIGEHEGPFAAHFPRIAVFEVFHGHAHGLEVAGAIAAGSFVAGLMVSSVLEICAAMACARLASRRNSLDRHHRYRLRR